MVVADASSYGLGAVLTQIQPDSSCRPVAYASQALTSTEVKYAQIEKIICFNKHTWTCEHFSYLIGKLFHMQTDPKTLVSLVDSKLDTLQLRIQHFRMKLMRFTYTISHIPGKDLTIVDALSRSPVSSPTSEDVDAFVDSIMQNLPETEKQLQQIEKAQKEDAVRSQLIKYCQEGWPNKHLIPSPIKPYLHVHIVEELLVQQNLLLRGSRIMIPVSMQLEMLGKLHGAHQGIHKCQSNQYGGWGLVAN